MQASPAACAEALLEVVPLIMRAMRAEVRKHRAPELSLPQFRALAFVGRNEGAALSDLATFLGLTLPSASKLVDGLVAMKFIVRETDRGDRRRVSLALSAAGRKKYDTIGRKARELFAQKVAPLPEIERERLLKSLSRLRTLFEHDQPAEVAVRATASNVAALTRVHPRAKNHASPLPAR